MPARPARPGRAPAAGDAAPARGPTLCELATDPLAEIASEVGADLVAEGSLEGLTESMARANLAEALAKGRPRQG